MDVFRMLTTGHLALAYVLIRLAWILMKTQSLPYEIFLFVGLFSAIFPDFDLIPSILRKKGLGHDEKFQHHNWLTHTIFPYFLASFFLIVFNWRVGIASIIGSVSHILMDSIGSGDGIMWFYPFSKRKFGILLLRKYGDEWLKEYIKHPVFAIEVLIYFLAIVSFFFF